jgi:predicted TIM-barrel fold metal-dependent hydrolase
LIGGKFVIDAVVHAYNHLPSNWEDPVLGHAMVELAYHLGADPPDPQYGLTREQYLIDWQIPDVANFIFGESDTDVAVMHPLAIAAFKDGYSSVAKAAEALERYPNRFIGAYACVDPLKGAEALSSMEMQADLLKPLGLKLYPTSWDGTGPVSWRMDDPKLIYPLYEKAQQLGIKTVAVHKAVPIGPFAVGDAYNPRDLENAATTFPDLNFEIVHGGLAFLEETAWLLARFGNIAINMEIQNILVERRPRAFAEVLLGLCRVGGSDMLNRMFWGTGGTLAHNQPALEAFDAFRFPEDLLEGAGLFKPIRQITEEDKANMLAGTFARLHGLDLEQIKQSLEHDEFSRGPGDRPAPPLSSLGASTGETIYA